MYRVQGTLREWVSRDEVGRFIVRKFKYVNINVMVSGKGLSGFFIAQA